MSRRRWLTAARVRRTVQLGLLLLFFGLLLALRPHPESKPPSGGLKLFFLLDPLVLAVTWLANWSPSALWQAGDAPSLARWLREWLFGPVPAALWWALVTAALTLLLGRVFCGWICPFGTLHDIVGRVFDRLQSNQRKRSAQYWSPGQRAKYYLLAGFLLMALFGGHFVCLFDPLVILYRSTTAVLLPMAQWGVEEGSTAIYQADPGWGPVRLTKATEPAYAFLRDHVFVAPKQTFLGVLGIGALLLVLLLANGYRRRFWCRYLCPLGALLGLLSWRPLWQRKVDAEHCRACDLCGQRCHGAAAEGPGRDWKPAECLGCMNCLEACGRGSLSFGLVRPWRRRPSGARLGLSRRSMLGAALGGVIGLGFLRANRLSRGPRFHPRLIRPPGALPELEFLRRCTACGMCIKICPTGGLQPAVGLAGLEGLWTPYLVPSIGHCEYSCNLCGQICPTGAIQPLPVAEKQQVKIGLAAFDTTRCLPYAYGRECMVCEEHCPVPDKAIYFLPAEVADRDGNPMTIKQPHVDEDLCIGCGRCENVCVFTDQPAIRVFSANEQRNPHNQPILPSEDFYY